MTNGARAPWWCGARGEWYVAVQLVLFALVFLAPRRIPAWPAGPAPFARIALFAGAALMVAGGGLLLASAIALGANLTPLPYPKAQARLVQSGPYRLVRHPIYAGVLLLAFGWVLALRDWPTLAFAILLLLLFEVKSAREERWLAEKFPDYADYQRRVRKLIPYVH